MGNVTSLIIPFHPEEIDEVDSVNDSAFVQTPGLNLTCVCTNQHGQPVNPADFGPFVLKLFQGKAQAFIQAPNQLQRAIATIRYLQHEIDRLKARP